MTSVPISGRAGVAMEAPEIDTSSTRHAEDDAFGQRELAHGVAWRDALVAPLGHVAHFHAVGEPGELRSNFLALVMGCVDLESKTTVDAAHYRALDPTEVIEIGNHALADFDGDRGQDGSTSGGDIHQAAGIFLLVRAHEAAEHDDSKALVTPAIRHDPRQDAQRTAGERRLAA